MTVNMPYQCFINGQFTDAEDGKTYDTINPTDGSVSDCSVGTVTTGCEFLIYSQLSDSLKKLLYSVTLPLSTSYKCTSCILFNCSVLGLAAVTYGWPILQNEYL